MLDDAVHADVAFLVVGDPFAATTHTDLQLRAREKGVAVRAIHNASIVNAVAVCGLQLYRFGQTVSIVFFTGGLPSHPSRPPRPPAPAIRSVASCAKAALVRRARVSAAAAQRRGGQTASTTASRRTARWGCTRCACWTSA